MNRSLSDYVSSLPKKVTIRDVGTREGFQRGNIVPTDVKVRVVNSLVASGITKLEIASFGSRSKMPNWADAEEMIAQVDFRPGVTYGVLVFTASGIQRAIAVREAGYPIDEVASIIGVTEPVLRNNGIPRTLDERRTEIARLVGQAHDAGLLVRMAVSAAFGCSFEGWVDPRRTLDSVAYCVEIGVDDVHIGDSTGQANPVQVLHVFDAIRSKFPTHPLSVHFHNNRGLALPNILALVEHGFADHITFDSSFAEIGGCPFIGASGNVSTEDLVLMMEGMGIGTGVDVHKVIEAGQILRGVDYGEQLVSHSLYYGPPDWWKTVSPVDYIRRHVLGQ